jgi:hypothetical protein
MVLNVETNWYCPNCSHTHVSPTALKHAVVHICSGLHGLIAPLIRVGTKCKIEAREREDYVGSDVVTLNDEGRPIMAIVTTRDDGQDCRILAPVAVGGGRSGMDRV